ncbi:MAG: terpene cyclase/mutase family protein [Opitutales bacterium]|nr:terpene cyclase/mutase family protein [Opitutales bacterium]
MKFILLLTLSLSLFLQNLCQADQPAFAKTSQKAIDQGCNFLLKNQNSNGSWGSATKTKGLNIYAPIPGSHRAFRMAVSALSISALLKTKARCEDFKECINKGTNFLLQELPNLRRATPMAIYNIWSHAYGIQALCLLYSKTKDPKTKQQIHGVIQQQVNMLEKYESIDGGWGYYDFRALTKKPSGSSISFVNATGLVALKDAEKVGIEVPLKLVTRAISAIHRQKLPDYSYLYGEYLKYRPRRGINRPAGSLGRSHACNYALHIWEDPSIDTQVHLLCLDRLFARNGWLDVARKRPIPHESWFAVAGYFFYYGHMYASHCITTLPSQERQTYQIKMVDTLTPLQEKDGSWWDFPLYNYHKPYGTAMAILSLNSCLPALPKN